MADMARMMADLGNMRRDDVSAPEDDRGRPGLSDREARELRQANEDRRNRIINNAPAGDPRAATLAAWNTPETFGGDSIAEGLENRYSGQGHRRQLLVQTGSNQNPNGFNEQRSVGRSGSSAQSGGRPRSQPNIYVLDGQPSPNHQRAASPRSFGTVRHVPGARARPSQQTPEQATAAAQLRSRWLAVGNTDAQQAAPPSTTNTATRPAQGASSSSAADLAPTPAPTPAAAPSTAPAPAATPSLRPSSPAVPSAQAPPRARRVAAAADPAARAPNALAPSTRAASPAPSSSSIAPHTTASTAVKLTGSARLANDFATQVDQLRCTHRVETPGDDSEWLSTKAPNVREVYSKICQIIASKMVKLAKYPSSQETEEYLEHHTKRKWIFAAAINSRNGLEVKHTDPVIMEIIKLTNEGLIKESKMAPEVEQAAAPQVEQQVEQPAIVAEAPEPERRDSVIGTAFLDGGSISPFAVPQTRPASTVGSSAPATPNGAIPSVGFLTTTYYDNSGNVIRNDRFDITAPVHVAVGITASDTFYDPLVLANAMEGFARSMGTLSKGVGSGGGLATAPTAKDEDDDEEL